MSETGNPLELNSSRVLLSRIGTAGFLLSWKKQMSNTYTKSHDPLDHIVFISIPEDAKKEINGFTLDPAILIPVEYPSDAKSLKIDELSWEMIVSAMLKIFAYNPRHKDTAYYRKFIDAMKPNLVAELTKTGIIKAEAKDFSLAEEIFLALCHIAPEEDKTFLNLAFVYEAQADYHKESGDFKKSDYYADKALQIYYEALEVHPNSIDIHFYAGYFFLKQNHLSQAQEFFELFLGLAQDDDRSAQVQDVIDSIRNQTQDDKLFTKSFELIKMGHEKEALDNISEFLIRHPSVWNAWFLRGWANRRLLQYDKGKEALLKCLEYERGNTDVYNELSICCMETGDLKGARKYLHKALAIEPDNVKIISNLGVLELKNGVREEAKKYFTIAAELNPKDPIIQKYLLELA